MKITLDQIRAARSLKNWTQTDLAQAASVSRDTIKNIEAGKPAQQNTIDKVVSALRMADIEFLENEGIKKRTQGVTTYEGKIGFAKFREDVLEEARKKTPDICISNVDERQFDKWGEGDINKHYRGEMAKIRKKNPSLGFRTLVKKGDMHLSAANHSEYKWVPDREFGDFPFYIYGNRTALLMFEENNINIFILNHPQITKFYREQFNQVWATAESMKVSN